MSFPAHLLLLVLLFFCGYGAAQVSKTLDPVEVEALQIFATRLGFTQLWNFSVDPCTGLYGWNNTKAADNFQPSSGVECDCSGNSTSCHVTKLIVFNMNVAGEIAPEVGNFSFLGNLNLGQNVITGTLPEQIGSLSRLQYLNVGINRITGSLPASFGNLLQLVSMGIGTNFLTGSLPKEIGNLKTLTQIYMDSSGLNGQFPEEFGNLQNLNTLWMSDNAFNGTLDFLGNLTNLVDLKMEGNNFRGTLPSSLGKLQKLKTLYIGDLAAGGRIPETLNSLTELNVLSLRNCELSGAIPDLTNLTSLIFLDLSFNNFSGPIPSSFGSLEALDTLLLAHNNFSGTVPGELGSIKSLQRLDVSFNNLSGSFPASLNRNQLQENIIGNRFNVSRSQGQNAEEIVCLEGGSDCDEVDGGKNFELNINCGGPEVVSSEVRYDQDSAALTDAAYYSNSSDQSWAVSSTGYADFNQNNKFVTTRTASNRITGTSDPSLYSTARASPSSLKYFALGLRNGRYQVELHFAEIVIPDNSSGWTSSGRRYFDVYIENRKVLENFNIRDEARGSFKALVRNFSTEVSGNVLTVHLLWRGKGTCCSPAPNSFGPLISAIRVLPGFDTTGLRPKPPSSSKGKTSKGVGIGVGVGVSVLVILMVAVFLLCRRRRWAKFSPDEDELKSLESGKPNLYSYNQLKLATKGFCPENKLGQGGFGSVFKGVLPDGTVVAIKELSAKSHQGTREFLNEVTVISAVQHRNLVKLHGCCIEGSHRLLIYEFLENNSLHHALLSSKGTKLQIDWTTRFNICVGIARGIAYLHEESFPRIVHRDIKASNVLLDKTLNPKIADFGLAKLFQDQETHISTRVAGTIGYLAPEYAMRGHLTEKADVYSFGVLALEMVSGRENLDSSLPNNNVYLLEWAWQLYESHQALELVDPELGQNFSEEEALRVIQVALLCSQAVASARPRMSSVVAMLLGSGGVDVSSLQPGYFSALQNAAPGFYFMDADGSVNSKVPAAASGSSSSFNLTSAASSKSNLSMAQPR